MSSSQNTVYVVTGANRGIGLGLVAALLQRPSTTVIGTVRTQSTADTLTASFDSVSFGKDSIFHPMVLDFAKAPEPKTVAETFKSASSGTDHIDVLIFNAGYSDAMCPSLVTKADSLRNLFEINTISPLMTFQGLWPLLQKSRSPKFIYMSSSLGSIAAQEPIPAGAYGPSKAAGDWLTRSLHIQLAEAGLVSLAIMPGFVKTDMGAFAAEQWNHVAEPNITVPESVTGILKVVDEATRDNHSGKLMCWNGEEMPW